MSIGDLRSRYHKPNAKPRQLISMAIREELAGGQEALEALELLYKMLARHDTHDSQGKLTALAVAYNQVGAIVNAMDRAMRRKYDLPCFVERVSLIQQVTE